MYSENLGEHLQEMTDTNLISIDVQYIETQTRRNRETKYQKQYIKEHVDL